MYRILRYGRNMLPIIGSLLLLSWLIWRVDPQALQEAFVQLDWPRLLPLTVVLVAAVYLWDSACLTVLFRRGDAEMPYRDVLRARGLSYLFTVINWSLGQGLLAWLLARVRRTTLPAALGRCLSLAYVDLLVLFALALLGSLASGDQRVAGVEFFSGTGLALLAIGLPVARLTARHAARQWPSAPWGGMFDLANWTWSDFVRLAGMRLAFFAIGMTYLGTALSLLGIQVDWLVIISILPIVALVEGLPISVAGLGTRETALIFLLRPEEPATLVAFCLVWSLCIIVGRVLIGGMVFWSRQAKLLVSQATSAA